MTQLLEYAARPKRVGLWLRIQLDTGQEIEGSVANDMLAVNPHKRALVMWLPGQQHQPQACFEWRHITRAEVLGVVGKGR